MTIVPHFSYPPGTEITLYSQDMVLNRVIEHGYELTNLESGTVSVVPFLEFIRYLKLPGTRINAKLPETGDRHRQRLGGHVTSEGLPEPQVQRGHFLICLCQGMRLHQDQIRTDTQDPSFRLTIQKMNSPASRKFVQVIASALFKKPIHLNCPRGGQSKAWYLFKGRTLVKYLRIYEDLRPDEDPLDALVPLDHKKGNRRPAISDPDLWRLATDAWEEIGLDTKGPSVANVKKHLDLLVYEENKDRKVNGLGELTCPSESTLRAHRKELLGPKAYAVATKGERQARNESGGGSSDFRALLIGELVEVDEYKMSLVASAKRGKFWNCLSNEHRDALEEIDKEIRARWIMLVMVDVASRMPLAWVITENVGAEATLALYRMATRDKTREKIIYGCKGHPVGAIGLGNIKTDNGPGLRNSVCITAVVGLGAMYTAVRAYNSTDKPYVERAIGTTESVLWKLIHGYTGRKAGELTGYDAKANGVLDIDQIYGILTRFLIDEYPSTRHMGVGMGGRRPYEVWKQINDTRGGGAVGALDPNMRRIQLGWRVEATPNDEGVRVFTGLWYSSPEFQELRDGFKGKVSVFVDPDDLTQATVLMPHVQKPIPVDIQITAFADLTLPEVLNLMEEWRREHPTVTEIHDDILMTARRQRFDLLRKIGVERKLARSYSTFEECRKKARVVFRGARVIPTEQLPDTATVGRITQADPGGHVFRIGAGDPVIEGSIVDDLTVETEAAEGLMDAGRPSIDVERPKTFDSATSTSKRTPKPQERGAATSNKAAGKFLGRPKDLGKLK